MKTPSSCYKLKDEMKLRTVLLCMGLIVTAWTFAQPPAAGAANALLSERDFCRTSAFGSWRFGHLHAGIDLSTGGVTGVPVVAIDSCWVWRVSVRHEGYGKALYVRLPDGKIAVYGHLSAFAPEIETAVEREQDLRGAYEVDIYHEPYALNFARGETIAFSGESGWGPPHLHFELRSGMYDHLKISPFPDYVECADTRPPVIQAIRVVPVGTAGAVNGDPAAAGVAVAVGRDSAETDTLYLAGDFGLMVRASDYTGCGRVTTAVLYEARVDGETVWRLNLSKFPFSSRNLVWSLYHFDDRGARYVRLFNPWRLDFNGFEISHPDTGFGGFTPGLHELGITVGDACGNLTTAAVPFYYGTFPAFEKFAARRSATVADVDIEVSPWEAHVEIQYSVAGGEYMSLRIGDGSPGGLPSSGRGKAPGKYSVTFPVGPGDIDIRCRISNELGFAREGIFRIPEGISAGQEAGTMGETASGREPGAGQEGRGAGEPGSDPEADLDLHVTGGAVEITARSDTPPSELPIARVFEGIRIAKIPLQPVGEGAFRGSYIPRCQGDALQARTVFVYGAREVTALAGTPVACLERASSAVLLTETFRLRIDVPRDMRPGVLLGYEEGAAAYYEGFTDSLGSLMFEPAGTFFGERARVCLALREGSMTVKQGVFADRGESASFRARADSSGTVCFETDFIEKLVVLEDRERPEITDFEGQGRREDGRFLFTARARDAGSGIDPGTVSAFVDGQAAIAGYDPDTGLITGRTTKVLRAGEHRFTLEVKDRMGNRTSSEHTLTF